MTKCHIEVASKGASFGAVCEAFAPHVDSEDLPAAINQALNRWLCQRAARARSRNLTGLE